jgi:ankyrin repeat protein
MLQPVEFGSNQPISLTRGYSTTTDEIWRMLTACHDGDLSAVHGLIECCPGLVHCEYNYTPPIHFAVREGHVAIVRLLLAHSADPTYRSYRFRDSLLQMARERGYDEIVALLEEELARRFPLREQANALLTVARTGDLAGVQRLLDLDPLLATASNETGDTALHKACAGGHSSVAELLLDRCADPEAVNSDGFKPIHSAIFFNNQGWVRYDAERPTESLRAGRLAGLLLARGAKYNIFLAAVFADHTAVKRWLEEDAALANFEDTHHRRPISAAAWRSDEEMVQLLLDHSADPNLPESGSPRGHALWIAAFRRDIRLAHLLLKHGADPEQVAESGGRALDHARDTPELFQMLVNHGAEPGDSPKDRLQNAITDDDLGAAEEILAKHPYLARDATMFWNEGILAIATRDACWEMIDLLFNYGATVPKVTKWGKSYYFKHLDVGRYLLKKGANPNHKNWHSTTLLHDVVYDGEIEKARLLLDHGAEINSVDEEYCSTPLGLAARAGHREMVEFLLQQGADPTAAGADWATPLEWADRGGHTQIVELLRGRRQ